MSISIKKTILLAFCLVLIWTVTPASSYADDWDKATKITTNQAFEIPGMVLPAGTYVVKIVDMAGDHHVVRFPQGRRNVFRIRIAIGHLVPALKPSGWMALSRRTMACSTTVP